MLPFLAALKQVSDSDVELMNFAQIARRKLGGLEDRQELGVKIQGRVGPEISGDLLRLVLQNESPRRLERMIVRQG